MTTDSYLTKVISEFAQAIEPLTRSVDSIEDFTAFLAQMGWALDQNAGMNSIQGIFNEVKTALDDLQEAVSVGKGIDDLTEAVSVLVSVIADLANTTFNALSSPLDQAAFWQGFPDDVLEMLIYLHLEKRHAFLFGVFLLSGVLKKDLKEADAVTGRLAYERMGVDWGRIPESVYAPQDILKDVHGWGMQFKHRDFMIGLSALLVGFRASAQLYPVDDRLLNLYYDPDNPNRLDVFMLTASPYQLISQDGDIDRLFKVILVAMPVPPKADRLAAPEGLVLFPVVTGSASTVITLQEGVELSIGGGFEVEIIKALFRPGETEFEFPPLSGSQLQAKANLHILRSQPLIIAGDAGSTRLEFSEAHLNLALLGPVSDPEYQIEAVIDEAGLVLDFSESDGFLQKLLGSTPQNIRLNYGIAWSSKKGLTFLGRPTLDLTLPVHLNLFNVLHIDTIYLSFEANLQSESVRVVAALTGGVSLGPIKASVDRIGIAADMLAASKSKPGNLGTLNFAFGFKPPAGAGMVLDAKVVTGGGYIEFNPDEEQYAGILQLEIEDMISIKAIALLTTRVPGLPPGVKGFSLLVILTAEFPPIQLGYGFALLGVGGLFGANRTMLLDPLRDGIKNHTVDSILFPNDPVENAQRIISDLRSIFPPADGRFVLGPMVKLSWGTPPIITGELGILLELPAPIRLAILGKLTLALPPVPGAEVLIMRMDVIGAIDFDKSDASIDATLVDSRVAIFPLTGDMAMRLNWGPSPVFALSAGGFHPRFQPPPNFPALSRLAISLATGDNPRLRLEAYMAVTASTAMMGARLDAYVEEDLGELIGKLTVQAYLSFDTLVQFSPFSLIAEMKGGATLKRNGQNLLALTLAITLTGPQPWHAWGEARFEFLGKHRIGFDVTIGQPAGAPAKISISPLDELVKALSDPHAWSAQLPDERHMLATIRRIEPGQDEVLVHPLGSLTLRQRVVPLGLDLEKFGEANIAGARRYDFDIVLAGAGAAAADLTKEPVKDSFSAAQFFEMSDDEKLGRPAFESFPSGYRWTAGAGVKAGERVQRPFGYETVVIDAKDSFDRHKEDQPYILHGAVLQAAYGLGAAALSSMRSTGGARFAGPATQKVVVSEPAFAVADKVNLQTQSGARTATTYTEAELARRKQPDRAGYQVVASHEVRNA